MRVPNINTYYSSTYLLGNITESLNSANEVVSTQKQLNEMSDDPLALSQVMSLKNSIDNLEQIGQNVTMGKSWLESVENALGDINNLILDTKSEVTRLANDSISIDERQDAVERIDIIIEQIISLGNTQINGNYIFGGTKIDGIPLELDTSSGSEQVNYLGDETPFEVRTDSNSGIQVGRSGKESFWDTTVDINASNNTVVFTEDNGHGSASEKTIEAVIPDGVYTRGDLVGALENALNEASGADGYGASYKVDYDEDTQQFSIREDGSYDGYLRTQFNWSTSGNAYINGIQTSSDIDPDDVNVTFLNSDALALGTPEPQGSEPFTITWDGSENWEVTGNPGYVMPASLSGTTDSVDIDLDEDGQADISIRLDSEVAAKGASISFDIIAEKGDHSLGHEIGFSANDLAQAPPTSENEATFITDLTISSGNDTIEFVEVNGTGGVSATLTATLTQGNYTDMDALALEIETQLEAASAAPTSGANNTDYAVTFDEETHRFNIREDGTSLNEIQFQWSSTAGPSNTTANTLGFYSLDDTISYPTSDNTPFHGSITIDNTNNRLDFEETNTAGVATTLGAMISNGTYTDITALETAVENALNDESALWGNTVTYDVAYDDATDRFTIQRNGGTALNDFDLLWATGENKDNSIAATLGFDDATDDDVGAIHTSDTAPVLATFDASNNIIEFTETHVDGTVSDETKIEITTGDYTDLTAVASAIQAAMRAASPNNVDYTVDYDFTAGRFMIKGSDAGIIGFDLLWESGSNASESAASMLGFDPSTDDSMVFAESDEEIVNIVIDNTNNKIDFMEFMPEDDGGTVSQLTAEVEAKTYTSHEELAAEVEVALETESRLNGNRIDYSVTWDSHTRHFSIKENGTELDTFHLMWQSGENAPLSVGGSGESIGSLLGFETEDDINTPSQGETGVEWGIFNTLIDLKDYLNNNDQEGLQRTIGRLESHYDNMTSRIVDSGMKYSRLEVRETLSTELTLSLTERQSNMEDADIIKAIMDLQNIQNTYQAALSSTSNVLNISLVDYLR